MSAPYVCEVCEIEAVWRVTRRGDVVVTWACDSHLAQVCHALQREHEVTELVVTSHRRGMGVAMESLDIPYLHPNDWPPLDTKHGTRSGYEASCRCDECRAANAAYHAEARERRARRGIPDDVEHGLPGTYYNWGCRCWKCKTAQSVTQEVYRMER